MYPAWYPTSSFFTGGSVQVDDENKARLQQVEAELEAAKLSFAEKIKTVIRTRMRSKTSVFQARLSELDVLLVCATYHVRDSPEELASRIREILVRLFLLVCTAKKINIDGQLLKNTAEHLGYLIRDDVLNHTVPVRLQQAWRVASGALPAKLFADLHLKGLDMADFAKVFIVPHTLFWTGLDTIIESPSTVRKRLNSEHYNS